MTTTLHTAALAPPCFDRDYWLSHCEGYRVETAEDGRLGFVDHVERDEDELVVAVRAGLLGRRVLLFPASAVDFIVPRAQTLWLRSAAPILGMRALDDPR